MSDKHERPWETDLVYRLRNARITEPPSDGFPTSLGEQAADLIEELLKVLLIKPCPECGSELTYDKPFPGSQYEPPEEEKLYCEECDWVCEDYTGYIDDRGNEE